MDRENHYEEEDDYGFMSLMKEQEKEIDRACGGLLTGGMRLQPIHILA